MPLIIAVLGAGIFIEILGTIISIAGVAAMTGTNLIIIAFVLALDIGKIATISALYQYWNKLGFMMRGMGFLTILITVTVSSTGAGGYLSGELKNSLIGQQQSQIQVLAYESQIAKYEERKIQIDNQIANLPEKTSVAARLRMMNAFKEEQREVSAKIREIEKVLPELKQQHAQVEGKAGPIFAMAKSLDITIEDAINLVVGMLIVVFNPFAVYLVLLGNIMIKSTKEKSEVVAYEPAPENIPPTDVEEAPAAVPVVTPLVEEPLKPIPQEEVQEEVAIKEVVDITPVVEAIPDAAPNEVAPDIAEEEPEHLTRTEIRKRERYVSLLLDKALKSIPDGTTIMAHTPIKSIEYNRNV